MKVVRNLAKILIISAIIVIAIASTIYAYVNFNYVYDKPDFEPEILENSKGAISKNEYGVFEVYIEGSPYDRGLLYGELTRDQLRHQENCFIDQIEQLVPNSLYRRILSVFIAIFNRNLTDFILPEYLEEIYGVSESFSDEYKNISPNFMRILSYHAAHDIGHALNDYSLVGCTSFGVLDTTSNDTKLIIGRNFDFYVGDKFSEEKLILFSKPDSGYAFASYSWAGFMGVVSGMNEKGLSVTINSSKSTSPLSSKTPISLLTREILQYASNTDEAIEIARNREVFVSESILVGSREDSTVIIIEKTPDDMGVFKMKNNQVICSNHFQSDTFKNDQQNLLNIKQSESKHRYDRVKELLPANAKIDVSTAVSILRDQHSLGGDTLGMGNPAAINQLIAHHSVVFDNYNSMMYVSTNNWQLGEFIGYNLDTIFQNGKVFHSEVIPASNFIKSNKYSNFLEYRSLKKEINSLPPEDVKRFIELNSESYQTYQILGDYYLKIGDAEEAVKMYNLALSKNIPSLQIKDDLLSMIETNSK